MVERGSKMKAQDRAEMLTHINVEVGKELSRKFTEQREEFIDSIAADLNRIIEKRTYEFGQDIKNINSRVMILENKNEPKVLVRSAVYADNRDGMIVQLFLPSVIYRYSGFSISYLVDIAKAIENAKVGVDTV